MVPAWLQGPCGVVAGLRPRKLRALCLLLAAVLQAVGESAPPAEKTSKPSRLPAERVKRNYGPNICFNRGQQQCCPGWQRSAGSGQCLQAHCPFGCGNGVCIAPYTCRCPTGPNQGYHISCQDEVENTLRPDVYTVQEGLPPLPVDLSKEHSSPYRRIRVHKRITIKKRPKVPPRPVDQEFSAAALVETYPVGQEVVESTGVLQPGDTQYVDRGQTLTLCSGYGCGQQTLCVNYGGCQPGQPIQRQPTSCATAGCEQRCQLVNGQPICTCYHGYTLKEDGRYCADVDECTRYGNSYRLCEQECQNTVGSYYCSCQPGFVLQPNRRTCSPVPGIPTSVILPGDCTSGCPGGEQICGVGFELQQTPYGEQCVEIDECTQSHCSQGCRDSEGGFTCTCLEGFKLDADGTRCIDEDECSQDNWRPCHQICQNTVGSFQCSCQHGFRLLNNGRSCMDINECTEGRPRCHHQCQNTYGSYKCTCRSGFRLLEDGSTCGDIDECAVTAGICQGACVNTIGSYQCACPQGYNMEGGRCVDVDECRQPDRGRCEQMCVNNVGSYFCSCNRGFVLTSDGRGCGDIDECELYGTRVCQQGCTNTYGSYTCHCPDGYKLHENGQNCVDVDECQVHTRMCHYECQNTMGSFSCSCPPGYTLGSDGRTCNDIDECALGGNGCQHGCQNNIGSYVCVCRDGYTIDPNGQCVDEDECGADNPCSHQCVNTEGGFQCLCPRGLSLMPDGQRCEDRDECAQPSQGGCHHSCVNIHGSYYCTCNHGYRLMPDRKRCQATDTGTGCPEVSIPCPMQCPQGFRPDSTGVNCVDIDECQVLQTCGYCSGYRKCSHTCVNTAGSFYCTCPPSLTLHPDGRTCVPVSPQPTCDRTCLNGGTCRVSGGCYTSCVITYCECPDGFTGLNCEIGAGGCSPPCANGGSCVEKECVCPPGLTGKTCAIDINECQTNVSECAHRCQNTFGSFQCLCPPDSTLNADGKTCKEIGCFPDCMSGGSCVNNKCVCPTGLNGPTCQQDVNECLENNGECDEICRNTFGSYNCFCKAGTTLNPDGKTCSDGTCQPACENGGKCENGVCLCREGFMGPSCAIDIDECGLEIESYRTCDHDCVNTVGSYYCTCVFGYQLQEDGRSCKERGCDPACENGGTCQFGQCICPVGYSGPTCSSEEPCEPACENGGTCVAGECLCPPGYLGPSCAIEAPCEPTCENGGTCKAGQCVCPPGYLGPSCAIEAPCEPTCENGGTCKAGQCVCPPGYLGPSCAIEAPCEPTCENGGTCVAGQCLCPLGYLGPNCAVEAPCEPSCENGGTCKAGQCVCPPGYLGRDCLIEMACEPTCENGGTCKAGQCICPPGYLGPSCAIEAPCEPTCENGGTCVAGQCLCPLGYLGPSCAVEAPCEPTCENGGTCKAGQCLCPPGYLGPSCAIEAPCEPTCENGGTCKAGQCVCPPGYLGPSCVIEAPCEPTCENGGTCKAGQCVCEPGYLGPSCAIEAPCEPTCENGGTCVVGQCLCPLGYLGPSCAVEAPCEPTCENGGTCKAGQCVCPPGYLGPSCAIEAPCEPTCENGGTCKAGQCICPPGYLGPSCAIEAPCEPTCENGGTCKAGQCVCPPGYLGPICAIEEPCEPTCENGGTCKAGQCVCPPGYLGPSCAIEMACEPTCENGGTCKAGQCVCPPGYLGPSCAIEAPCEPTCENGGTCKAGQCVCPPGYLGPSCAIEAPCEPICENGGTCVAGQCLCPLGYLGPSCAIEAPCEPTCENGGTCVAGQCVCPPGYLGRGCAIEAPCEPTCENGGTCKAGQCVCPPGYLGPSCAIEAPCEPTCENGGTCKAGQCVCPPGYLGPSCAIEAPCEPACENGGTCVAGQCLCPLGYLGPSCAVEAPCEPTCENGGTCKAGQCVCPPGYLGPSCAIEAPCEPTCENGGTCKAGQCVCPPGYLGPSCAIEAPCEPTCENGGTCVAGQCVCPPGYLGPSCAIEAPCEPTCENGGTCKAGQCVCPPGYIGQSCSDEAPCEPTCVNGATCKAGVCICPPGFLGPSCEIDIDECGSIGLESTSLCDHNCVNTLGSYYCTCRTGYQLRNDSSSCKDIDECLVGMDECHPTANCTNTVGSYTCSCNVGHVGDGRVCLDIDECDSGTADCDPAATCTNTAGSYSCECNDGYEGDGKTCVATCYPPCGLGSRCVNGTCLCPPGFVGDACNADVDECVMTPGVCEFECENTIGSYRCVCPAGFRLNPEDQSTCLDIDECEEEVCSQQCMNSYGSFKCTCDLGFVLDVDGFNCTELKLFPCTFDGVLYESGSTWEVDLCTECSCNDGIILCSECPTLPCTTTEQPEGDCCPRCKACIQEGLEYQHQDSWSPMFDSCQVCTCLEGETQCEPVDCDLPCTHPVVPPGECCGECTDCSYEGSVIPSGTVFFQTPKNCSQCLCLDGDVQCIEEECPPVACSNPIQGPCCPYCPEDCIIEDEEGSGVYEHGEVFNPSDDPCVECTCMDGELDCQSIECIVPNCPIEFQFQPPGTCCTICSEEPIGCLTADNTVIPIGRTFTLQGEPCKFCSCQAGGNVACETIECEVSCTHPVTYPGVCCPDCSGACSYNNVTYPDGGAFPSADADCENCTCLEGNVQCEPVSCAILCSHPYQPEGACCPICEDCYYQGRFHENRGIFVPENNPCQTCLCALGHVTCTSNCPPLNCTNKVLIPGECCPVCTDETCVREDGVQFAQGQTWTPLDDPCTQCACVRSGIVCRAVTCEVECTYGLQTEDTCCPDCSVCDYEEVVYQDGQVFQPNGDVCTTCTCEGGEVNCVTQTCPDLTCTVIEPQLGKCCPKCQECVDDDGMRYSHGQPWSPANDSCTSCLCANAEISCTTITCPAVCDKPTLVPGYCCPVCDGCEYNGQKFQEGDVFKPDDDQCVECQCQDDQLVCSTIVCPIPACSAEETVLEEGACCPMCKGEIQRADYCEVDEVRHPSGSSFKLDDCTTCVCENGNSTCRTETCANLLCPTDEKLRLPGECCPICRGLACMFENEMIPYGETFTPKGDNCSICVCKGGDVPECERVACPLPKCNIGNQVLQPGSCCVECTVEEWCYYRGDRYLLGETWTDECNDCVCVGGDYQCTPRTCPTLVCNQGEMPFPVPEACCDVCVPDSGTCIVFGDPHYRTFDGRYHDFQGTCTYILSEDGVDNTFQIIVQNALWRQIHDPVLGECPGQGSNTTVGNDGKGTYAVAWTQLVSIHLGSNTIDLLPGHSVFVNKEVVELPYAVEPVFSIQRAGEYVVMTAAIGIKVSWDGEHFVEVEAAGSYRGKLQGLCGDFNAYPDDDLRMANGNTALTASDFGNSWEIGERPDCSCRYGKEIKPCESVSLVAQMEATRQCSILKSEIFQPAHRVMAPEPFFDACRYDLCACPEQDRCLCGILSAYAHEAAKQQVILDWRTNSLCGISCPEGFQYDECGPSCPQTCDSTTTPGDRCLQACVPGCFCAAGMVLHNLRCISPSDCPTT
ncbi:kielin/chordin-like protein isoform X5 [Branchiostoma floridae]|uniref:Kielin/chordin-like protein isoform X5 n=1 Tax=Branchiostoma floridae TaxID=7739 RepID=A0A9J7MI63_BRAFL|nr:kielin/chordin-like protein isoform X5 [Branchiostoma floridae]